MNDTERFWSIVDCSPGADECWLWLRAPNSKDGYGRLKLVDGSRVLAHRYAYELTNGPIPEGMIVMHSCDNPPCCNPRHLSAGTSLDNNRDRARKGRSAVGDRHGFRANPAVVPRGTRNGKAKLTPAAVRSIRDSTEPHAVVAELWAVSEDTVRRIRNGSYRAWQWMAL